VESIVDFSENFSSKIYGFGNAFEYYKAGSCRYALADIEVPVVFVNALDDPLVPPQLIPFDEFNKNDKITLVTTDTGGHVAWISLFGTSWINRYVGDLLINKYSN
jgi:predicted alpha/beta-fold hydrolase